MIHTLVDERTTEKNENDTHTGGHEKKEKSRMVREKEKKRE